MAERRMISKTVVDSDLFLDMPLSSQALYFHLAVRADDDGFLDSPKKVQRIVGSSEDDLKLLITKNFLIPFPNGVIVVRHWRIHNKVPKDRYHPTIFQKEKMQLIENLNKEYELENNSCIQNGNKMYTGCNHSGN